MGFLKNKATYALITVLLLTLSNRIAGQDASLSIETSSVQADWPEVTI